MEKGIEAQKIVRAGQRAPFPDLATSWIGPLFLGLLFIIAAILTWQRIGDVLHDFGIQVYTPWLLSKGQALYRDLFWIYGPLAQNFNALLFYLQGYPSVRIIELADLSIAAVVANLIYKFLIHRTDRLTAFMGVLGFLVLGVFQHLTAVGNFSFLFPYAHEATHGTALLTGAVVVIAGARLAFESWAFFVGLLLGLAVLTKVEVAATGVLLLLMAAGRLWWSQAPRRIQALLFGFLVPVALMLLYFLMHFDFSLEESFAATFGAFTPVLRGGMALVKERLTYDAGPYGGAGEVSTFLRSGALLSALACVGIVADLGVVRGVLRKSSVFGVAALMGASLLYFVQELPWLDVARGVPLLSLGLLILARRVCFEWCVWAVFALCFALRLGLQFRFEHYGFFMAMPLTVAAIAQLLYFVPSQLRQRYGGGESFRWLSVLALIVYLAPIAVYSAQNFAARTVPIGHGPDRTYAFEPAQSLETQIVQESLDLLPNILSGNSAGSFLVLQNGSALNYLLKTANRTHFVWFSNETALLGQESVLQQDLQSHPPAAILLILPPNQTSWPAWPAQISTLLESKYRLLREWKRGEVLGGRLYSQLNSLYLTPPDPGS
ncbi:MAG: hypothetical protein K1X79_08475 [Oligoflexia bacterium]|nr:hypothetical protein [Oligoflexia bacterium]